MVYYWNMNTQTKKGLLAGVIMGVIVFIFATYSLISSLNLTKNGIVTDAKIVNVISKIEHGKGGSFMTYTPVFLFTDNDGISHQATSSIFDYTEDIVGSTVKVAYDKQNPLNVEVVSSTSTLIIICYSFSIFLFLCIFIIYRRSVISRPISS